MPSLKSYRKLVAKCSPRGTLERDQSCIRRRKISSAFIRDHSGCTCCAGQLGRWSRSGCCFDACGIWSGKEAARGAMYVDAHPKGPCLAVCKLYIANVLRFTLGRRMQIHDLLCSAIKREGGVGLGHDETQTRPEEIPMTMPSWQSMRRISCIEKPRYSGSW